MSTQLQAKSIRTTAFVMLAKRRASYTAFFKTDGHLVPDASDLDFYLFNREARIHEACGSERVARLRGELVHRKPSTKERSMLLLLGVISLLTLIFQGVWNSARPLNPYDSDDFL